MEIRNLSFRYPGSEKEVLKKVTIQFVKGKLNVVLGLNGAGKTTLFDLISGVYGKPEGVIHTLGPEDVVYQIQNVPFIPILKGKDVINFLLNVDHRAKRKRLKEPLILDDMDEHERELMRHLWNTRYGDMSIGEKRWLIITAICQMDRKLYIFDEPTSGVDPSTRVKIFRRIKRLVEDPGKLVIASSHHLHELEHVDCKLFLLHHGQIVFAGSYQEFLKRANTNNPDEAFQILTSSVPKESGQRVASTRI